MLIPQLILMNMDVRKFPSGATVLKEGEPGTSAFVLEEGEVVISVDGSEITSVSERGAILGEMSTLLGRNRGATVTTTRDSTFYVIDDLLDFLGKSSELSIQLLKLMARRIDEMDTVVINKRKWWHYC